MVCGQAHGIECRRGKVVVIQSDVLWRFANRICREKFCEISSDSRSHLLAGLWWIRTARVHSKVQDYGIERRQQRVNVQQGRDKELQERGEAGNPENPGNQAGPPLSIARCNIQRYWAFPAESEIHTVAEI